MLWLPAIRADVLRLAVPLESAAVPSDVEPSKNSTLPVAVPAPGALTATVAVKVTDWPNVLGLRLLATLVDVLACSTVWLEADDVLPAKLDAPAYTAVRLCEPSASDDVLMLAVPPDSVAVPSDVEPSKNSTEPVGVPLPAPDTATVAVIVTD